MDHMDTIVEALASAQSTNNLVTVLKDWMLEAFQLDNPGINPDYYHARLAYLKAPAYAEVLACIKGKLADLCDLLENTIEEVGGHE